MFRWKCTFSRNSKSIKKSIPYAYETFFFFCYTICTQCLETSVFRFFFFHLFPIELLKACRKRSKKGKRSCTRRRYRTASMRVYIANISVCKLEWMQSGIGCGTKRETIKWSAKEKPTKRIRERLQYEVRPNERCIFLDYDYVWVMISMEGSVWFRLRGASLPKAEFGWTKLWTRKGERERER